MTNGDDQDALTVDSSPILETKLYAPYWRPNLVSRPRLLEKLGRSPTRKLTLVSAPAGFGKTTLLAEWLTHSSVHENSLAWLSIDAGDNQPATFWTYVITALQSVQRDVGSRALSLLQSAQPPAVRTLLPGLLNDLSRIPHDFALVLDDYHLIENQTIHEDVAFVLDHLPGQMHIVITARADPPLPLPRLRVRGELTEVRAADLRFTPSEAMEFLTSAMGLALSGEDVDVLGSRTEGWIAGLKLAALSLQGRDDASQFIKVFGGDDRYVVDYLVEEVLRHQSDAVRSFLLETSILDRLSGPLCDAITRRVDSKATLETLERGNLFVVALDNKRQWYRYHHLFADVLQAYLLAERPDEVAALHVRASEWFEEHDQRSDAVRHALAAEDLSRAATLIERDAEDALRGHQIRRLVELLKPIPDELIRSMPVLSTYYGMALQGVGQMEASAWRLRDAERLLEGMATSPTGDAVDQAALHSLPSRIALARAYLASAANDVRLTVEHATRALELLPDEDDHWRGAGIGLLALAQWRSGDLREASRLHLQALAHFERAGDVVLALSSASHGADLLKARGRLVEARSHYERSLQRGAAFGDAALPGMAILHFGLSELHCEQNDLPGAEDHLQRGEELVEFAAQAGTAYRRCLARARLLRSSGDLTGSFEWIEEAERLFVRGAVPDFRPIPAVKARAWLAEGRLDAAEDWAREQGLSLDDDLDYGSEFLHITLARLLIAQIEIAPNKRSHAEVQGFLKRLLTAAESGGRTAAVIEILLLGAIACHLAGDDADALLHLERALALAEPEGYVRLFLDEGVHVATLLEKVTNGPNADYARRLLAASNRPNATLGPRPSSSDSLSERELEVMRLLVTDLSGPDIAHELVVSLNTMRTHTKSIYSKLGVNGRREAVRRAQELRLI